jgi:hypothetical protein
MKWEDSGEDVVRQQDAQFYRDGFVKLLQRWRKFIDRRGDYVEK